MKPIYAKLPTNADLSASTLEWAGQMLLDMGAWPAREYELRVCSRQYVYAAKLLKDMGVVRSAMPFSQPCNLVIDDTLNRDEWIFTSNGKSVGSLGA